MLFRSASDIVKRRGHPPHFFRQLLAHTTAAERSEARQDTRAGSYDRTLQTSAGEVTLKVPKLRRQTFETAIIERYRRRESSVEEALIEMYLAGISVRRVEDITEALWARG
jgi:putative transposase